MVVLETLNPALQKQEALTPNDKVESHSPAFVLRLLLREFTSFLHRQASSAEAENRQEEQDSDQEGKQSCKRKRSAVDPEPDLDVNRTHHSHFSGLLLSFSTSRFWIFWSHFSKNGLQIL